VSYKKVPYYENYSHIFFLNYIADVPPSNIKVPEDSVECNCDDHLERQDAQISLPISAKRCYELLFSNEQTAPPTNGGVWEDKTTAIVGHGKHVYFINLVIIC
jgi:hypothetical protein